MSINFSVKRFLLGVVIGVVVSFPAFVEAQRGNQGNQGSAYSGGNNFSGQRANWGNGGNGLNQSRPSWGGGNNWNGNRPGWNNGNNWNGNRTNVNVSINGGWGGWGIGWNNGWGGWGVGWNNGWGCCAAPIYVNPPIVYMQSAPVVMVQPSINQQLFQVDVLLQQGRITPEEAAIARANILSRQ